MRFLIPVLLLALSLSASGVGVFAFRRRARRRWASRTVSGGRKALVLNLFQRR